jgi:putative SOS response-associated peptidase YedK
MCGRYSNILSWREMVALYRITMGPPQNYPARYNIAPTQVVPVARPAGDVGRELAMLRWGLIPHWAKDIKIGYSTINARAETVATKPAFREAFKRRRCLVPATGYYEWRAEGGGKQPYHFVLGDGDPLTFAGLWERWDKGQEPVESFTIIVTAANDLAKPIHDRMPVILDPADWDAWLDVEHTSPADAQGLLKPYPAVRMRAIPVDRRVNSPKNDDSELWPRSVAWPGLE